MSDTLTSAQAYLQAPMHSFWKWDDDGSIAWIDGRTIVFREELRLVLDGLVARGLPPLTSVVLLMAATRDGWSGDLAEGALAELLSCFHSSNNSTVILRETLALLNRVALLDTDLKQPVAAKVELANYVFECEKDRGRADVAEAVVDLLAHRAGEKAETSRYFGPTELLTALRGLRELLPKLSAEALRLRRRTGLDALVQPAQEVLPDDLELSPSRRVRTLLDELRQDSELRGLAALAQRLMAAATLPRAISDREEMPLGGVSDLANRGSLDRLLISELAHDDLTLAVRIALNEALYLRREAPPHTPPRCRALLLDVGIRTWGAPRVYATAVALALAATAEEGAEVTAFRATANGIAPVELTTRAGLLAHLEALETNLHLGQALPHFAKAVARQDLVSDSILITTRDAWNDRTFRAALAETKAPAHLAVVDRQGGFWLFEENLHGSKLIREARMDLEELFAPSPRGSAVSLIDPELAQRLPAIFSVTPFPLRLPHTVEPTQTWPVSDQAVLSITRDRRLMLWDDPQRGARQIADDLPPGRLLWSSTPSSASLVHAVVGSEFKATLLQISLDRLECAQTPLEPLQKTQAWVSHHGVLFAMAASGQAIELYNLTDGKHISTFAKPLELAWVHGRLFRERDRWFAISFDGIEARLEPVLDRKAVRCPLLCAMFEAEGVEGPIGVTMRGDFYATATGNLRRVEHGLGDPVEVAGISRSGQNVLLAKKSPGNSPNRTGVCVDVRTLDTQPCNQQRWAFMEACHPRQRQFENLRTRFLGLGVGDAGQLTLISRKSTLFEIQLGEPDLVKLRQCATSLKLRRTFKSLVGGPKRGYSIAVASWDDGSQAFLDSRGLLHLKSSDPAVPETSIVLAERRLSGWCSYGRAWGMEYFAGPNPSSSREAFVSAIAAFAERLR